jgi:hypothetical protein
VAISALLVLQQLLLLSPSQLNAQTHDPCIAVTTTTDTIPPGVAIAVTWTQAVNVTPQATDAPEGFFLQVDNAPEVKYIPASFTICPDTKRGYIWNSLPLTLNPGNHALKITAYNTKSDGVQQRGVATIRNFTVLNPTVLIPVAPGNMKIQPAQPQAPPAPPPPE